MCAKNISSSHNFQDEVVQIVLNYIRSEGLKVGDRLPSQEQFADLLNVSRGGLQEAMDHLQTQGVIRQGQGVGIYVARDLSLANIHAEINLSITDIILDQRMEPGISEVSVSVDPVCFENELLPGEEIEAPGLCIRRVRTADGLPFAYSVAYLPLDIHGLSMDENAYMGSIYEYLQEKCNEFVALVDTKIEAQNSQGEICRKLGVPPRTPILVMHQKHYNFKGKLLMQSTDYLLRNQLDIRMHRVRPGDNDREAEST
jgi:GntR family transcriptional regulator